ncbi:CYFA0S05e01310g1_1 [Cyberlindnera fabianii]|uniref:Copper transport protein n=1 Tax=Cyberlindnera fabianii TaxID=36022 RepID=A0A061B0L2_CYBFA|nr:CYFA0S05e01310g1_1 [Cyberlindnera fabianii]
MDHSSHNMDMGDMPDMPGHEHQAMCSMNMLLNSDYENLCLLSSSWHIKTLPQFIISLLLVAVMGVGYEYVRVKAKRMETRLISLPVDQSQEYTNTSLVSSESWSKSLIYGVLVGYSYIMMLLFMTYNIWVMLAVVSGAVLGHHLFHGEMRDTMACH